MFGVEDLKNLNNRQMLHLYFNKMFMPFDYGAIFCWLKNLKEKTLNDTLSSQINNHFYENLPHVSYKLIFLLFLKQLNYQFECLCIKFCS